MAKSEAEKRIEKKRSELAELELELKGVETKVAAARAYLAGMEDFLELHSKDNGSSETIKRNELKGLLRDIQIILEKAGKPIRIEQILVGLGREKTDAQIKNVCSQLDREVRAKEFFTRPFKRTYGLIEFKASTVLPLKSESTSTTSNLPPAPDDDLPF
jgi:hypothetical protein